MTSRVRLPKKMKKNNINTTKVQFWIATQMPNC